MDKNNWIGNTSNIRTYSHNNQIISKLENKNKNEDISNITRYITSQTNQLIELVTR